MEFSEKDFEETWDYIRKRVSRSIETRQTLLFYLENL